VNIYRGDPGAVVRRAGAVVEARAYLAHAGGYPTAPGPEGWVRRAAAAELAAVCGPSRCAAGNPFRPAAADPRWLTTTVLALARGIYAERAFDRLPILADALQDAGCGNEDILTHCRGPGSHVRGCWVVDLVLGKG
jgi:hypothetical protein